MEEQTFNSKEACAVQSKLCLAKNYPHFAPYSGKCYYCDKDIYSKVDRGSYSSGISVESAEISLVTGCPHCNKSYCD